MLNMNDAPEQKKFGEMIPDGTFVKMTMSIRAGDVNISGSDPMDEGLFKASQSSDAIMLDLEFTVLEPAEYVHRKLWENWVVAGGSLDDKGVSKGWNMTKARIRAVLESATATSPKDMTPQAKANRMLQGFKQLDGCPFYAKLTVQEGNDKPGGGTYAPKNVIDYIVTPDEPEYAALRAGQKVEPKPRYAAGTHAGGSAAKPAWSQGGGAASATAAAPAWQRSEASPPGAAAPAPAQQQPLPGAASTPAPAPAAGPAWLRS